MDTSSVTPTATQLRALTHPVRLRMLGILRAEGPSTATALATRLGLTSGATSYHLRQLAQHQFITDDAARGNGRERWWRAAHAMTTTRSEDHPGDEDRETLDAYLQSVVVVHAQHMQQAVEERSRQSDEWRSASTMSDWLFRLTPRQATRLLERVEVLIEEIGTEEDTEADDGSAVPYTVMLHGFPRPDGGLEDPS